MKKLFKSLVALVLVFFLGNVATSCVSDPDGVGGNTTPVFEITGDVTVHTAISVEIPINIANIKQLVCYTREILVESDGTKYFVEGYDDNNQPIKGGVASTLSPGIVSRRGIIKPCEDGTNVISITGNDGLDKNRTYISYIVAKISDTEYFNNGEVYTVEFSTPNTYGEGDVHIIRSNFEGISVSVTMPEQVKAAGRRIKWGVTNTPMLAYNGFPPIPELLHNCDYVYPGFLIQRDTLLEINHYNAYRRNAKGEIGYYIIGNASVTEVSENSSEVQNGSAGPIQYYYQFMPGEPLVLLMSEVDYADCALGNYEDGEDANHKIETCEKKHPIINWGWGKGWYWYPYDFEAYIAATDTGGLPNMGVGGSPTQNVDTDKFWHEGAWYYKKEIRLPAPEKFNGTVDVKFENLSTQDGCIVLTPDEETYMYFVGIYENTNEYKQGFLDITRDYLSNDQSLWQWFTTTEMGAYFGIGYHFASEGPQRINLSDYLVEPRAGMRYHVIVNAVGKKEVENGEYTADVSAQNYQHLTFSLKNYTLPEPVLQVTAAEAYSPWKVKFILKNPDWKTNPISRASFVANYARDFAAYMKANNFTYTDMVMMNAGHPYYELSDADIEMINSNAGAEIEFDVLEKSSFTAAFIAWNTEGRASNPDSETTPGYATAESLANSDADPLDMTKINALKGDWTATATVNYLDAETGVFTAKEHSWKVSIGDLTSPSALSDEHYALFEKHGVEKAAADAYFAEFKQEEDTYNKAVKGQNRVLCQGWHLDEDRTLSTASPWDLFVMEDYNASTTSNLFYDFGPKWFLQVNKNGDVFIPVNYNRIPTFTQWYNGMAHHFCMGNYETRYAFPVGDDNNSVEQVAMPVEISEDGNSFTIKSTSIKVYDVDEEGKPIVDEEGNVITVDIPMYPNILYESQSGIAFYNNHIISEVVFTRGWNGGATPAPAKASVKSVNSKNVLLKNVSAPSTFKKSYSATTLAPKAKKVEAKTLTARQITPEETRQGMEKLLKKVAPIRK